MAYLQYCVFCITVRFGGMAKKATHRVKERYKKELRDFAKHLKKIRKSKQLTQLDVCELAGINFTSYNRTESGAANPSLAMLLALAEGLKVPLKELTDF
jgi:DNA-binding XRE family transcriptional regulator